MNKTDRISKILNWKLRVKTEAIYEALSPEQKKVANDYIEESRSRLIESLGGELSQDELNTLPRNFYE